MERMNWQRTPQKIAKIRQYKDILETEMSAKHTPQANICNMDNLLFIPRY